MTEQELREFMQGKAKSSGIEESLTKIAEMITATYERGFQDGMDLAARLYRQQSKH